jgi:hypothetical protein
MTGFLFVLLVIGTVLYILKSNRQAHKVDYSFGLKEARTARQLLSRKQYDQLEKLLRSLPPDTLTQTLDHLALSSDEQDIADWLSKGADKTAAHLLYGIYFGHQAWIARSHKPAEDVSEDAADRFYTCLDKSQKHLLVVGDQSYLSAEAYSRLIRIYMGEGEPGKVDAYFKRAIAKDNVMLWPYIHYAEAIQPKWGGTVEQVKAFYNSLPDVPLIRQVIKLKLIWDSYTAGENYMADTRAELDHIAALTITEIDREISENPSTSVHRYIVYNYLMVLADELNDNVIKKDNRSRMKEYYTLYPFGIIK